MSTDTQSIERLMRRCQAGVGGRHVLDDAHSIMADCYGSLGALVQERDRVAERLAGILGQVQGWSPDLAPHEQRVVDELAALTDKITKLRMFIQGEKFETVSAADRDLLQMQFGVMTRYAEILKQRVALFARRRSGDGRRV